MHVKTELETKRVTTVTLLPHELITIQTALAHITSCEDREQQDVLAVAEAMFIGLHKALGIE